MTPAQKLSMYRERYGIRLRKSLSQSFLVDPAVLGRIADSLAPGEGEAVVEIGAGAGFLTEQLLERGARVFAVEVDRSMADVLEAELGGNPRLEVMNDDALAVDTGDLARRAGQAKCAVIGNLPYHVATPVIFHLLSQREAVSRLVLMVQREVGVRMAAGPGSREYGALSVGTAYAADCRRLFDVGPGAFIPPPRVRSSVLALVPRPPLMEGREEERLFALVRASFGQRRKMLVNAVGELAGGRAAAERALARAGVDGTRRGETLSLAEFMSLARSL